MKKNIIFFVSALESGGLENYLLRFLNEKHKSFHSIYIYCKSGRSGQLENNFTNLENVTIIKDYLPYIGFKKYRDLGELLISKDISVVCDFTGNFSGRVLKIAKKIGVSKRVVFYRNSSHRFKKTFAKLLYNYYVNKLAKVYATDLLSNSIAGFEFFFSSMWEKDPRFKVIYNGLNCSEFLKEKRNLRSEFDIPSDAYIIGHTGRFNEAKNHQMILKVAEFLIKKHKNIYFILCGNEVRKNLNSYLQDKKINNRILAFDNRTDIAAFLNTG
jgi:glycosyltransferase involved in cell wall biosynthesis